jgi:hypothetical protein
LFDRQELALIRWALQVSQDAVRVNEFIDGRQAFDLDADLAELDEKVHQLLKTT